MSVDPNLSGYLLMVNVDGVCRHLPIRKILAKCNILLLACRKWRVIPLKLMEVV